MFAAVLTTEFMKLRRSKVTWATLAGLSMGPLGIALFMWIVREPGRAAQLGLLGTKASLAGLEATWPAYFEMLALIVGIGGLLLLAFIVAYVFGREYDHATAKNMLALPVRATGSLWRSSLLPLRGGRCSRSRSSPRRSSSASHLDCRASRRG
jgi:ABC-2 type transport system permease protein